MRMCTRWAGMPMFPTRGSNPRKGQWDRMVSSQVVLLKEDSPFAEVLRVPLTD